MDVRFNASTSPLVTCINANRENSMKYEGYFFEEVEFYYLIRIFPFQLSLVAFIQAILTFLLKPLGTTPVVAQILGGILMGPSFLMKNQTFKAAVFPDLDRGLHLIGTLGLFGSMLYLFLIGVKLDLTILMRSSKKEKIIGMISFILPLLFTLPLPFLIGNFDPKNVSGSTLVLVSVLMSTISFHTNSCFLADLNIQNTELGRLATSASTISGMCSFVLMLTFLSIIQLTSASTSTWRASYIFTTLAQILFITFVLRSIVMWIINSTPVGEPVKDIHLYMVYLMIFGTAILAEVFGNHVLFGPMILGLVIPDGPPLGSTLAEKLDPFVSGLLLPLYLCNVGVMVNISSEIPTNYWIVMLFCFTAFLGKLLGAIIPCLFYEIPLRDAFTLGLILSTLGIHDIQVYAFAEQDAGTWIFSLMVLSTLLLAAITSPLVRFLYNPSRRYIVYNDRTIQNVKKNSELRILVCVYNDENVPTIINLLEASHPNRENPIAIYLLHLIELMGRSAPLLVSHKTHKNIFHENEVSPSDHVINGFKIYEKQNQGAVFLQPFTSFTPFMSAHDDICTIAIDRRASFIIIPFHKLWNIDGSTQTGKWNNANKKVLKHAPCSVGILIDRGPLKGSRSVLLSWTTYKVGVIFLGGADDREALYYAMRMAGKENVFLTVHRLIVTDNEINNVSEKMLDGNVINEYRLSYLRSDCNQYIEEIVKDGIDIISMMRRIQNSYDLILVGRTHKSYARVFCGLIEWNEYPELGFFGDMFASSDVKENASVLVMQQHSCLSTKVLSDDVDKLKKFNMSMDRWF